MTRRDNRDALQRLFQGYVNDYGPEAGAEIIRAIVDIAGGERITVPDSSRALGVRYRSYSMRCIGELWRVMNIRFGDASGSVIMRKFITELKGLRISFPDHRDLYREERNRKIKLAWDGSNTGELAELWSLRERQILRIVREEVQ